MIERRRNRWRPGQDVAGSLLRAAADGSSAPTGSRVAAMVDWESWAERVRAPSGTAAILDERVTFERGTAHPCAGLTALRLGGAVPREQRNS